MTEQKKIRLFAAFQNEEHQFAMWDDLLSILNATQKHQLYLYMGMLESTQAEGYSNSNSNE